ncbi:MAG: hypothetical protein ACRDT6_16245, partial [Micromonosporaceae bacterium]
MSDTTRVPGAPTEHPALARCVPVSAERFGRDYWGRAPLLSRAGVLRRKLVDEVRCPGSGSQGGGGANTGVV